jgi:FkbM family methyltransferase
MASLTDKLRIIRRVARLIGAPATARLFVARALGSKSPTELSLRCAAAPLHVRPGSDDPWVMLQVFDSEEYHPVLKWAPRNVLDLGGNCGFTAIYLANKLPEARIVTVEPDPDNFRILQQNVKPYANICPINAAIWKECGELYLSDRSLSTSSRSFTNLRRQAGATPTKAITIQALSSAEGVEMWDVIKMDIEGGEVEMLQNAAGWVHLAKVLAVEIHDFCRPQAEGLLRAATSDWRFHEVIGETYWCSRDEP